MSEGVPADLPNCSPHRRRSQMTLQDVPLTSGLASTVCEDPVLRPIVQTALAQSHQSCGKARVNWKSFTRGFGLRITSLPFTTPRRMKTVKSSQLKSPHCRPTISLARRPRQAATRTILRYGSPSCPEGGGSHPLLARAVWICVPRVVAPSQLDCDRSVPIAVRVHKQDETGCED